MNPYPCSVEFQRHKDSTAFWALKSYHAPGDEDAAVAKLQELDAELTRKYRPALAAS